MSLGRISRILHGTFEWSAIICSWFPADELREGGGLKARKSTPGKANTRTGKRKYSSFAGAGRKLLEKLKEGWNGESVLL
jgi:hypothetical protein